MKNIIIIIVTFLIYINCNREIEKNANIIFLENAIEHAIVTNKIPDYNYLFNNNPFGDSIIITSCEDSIYNIIKEIQKFKLKVMSHDEICQLAFALDEDSLSAPNFLEVYSLSTKSQENVRINIGCTCVIPNWGAFNNKKTGEPGDPSKLGKCGFAFLCGG